MEVNELESDSEKRIESTVINGTSRNDDLMEVSDWEKTLEEETNSNDMDEHKNVEKQEKHMEENENGSDGGNSKDDGNDRKDKIDENNDSDYERNKDNDDDEEEEEDKGNKKVPTDEYGRELSAYEIMRLERIRRNKAYLAQLGLEEEKRGVRNSIQKEKEQKKKDKKKRDDEVFIERRKSMARKSKAKEVDYSGDALKALLKPQRLPSEKKQRRKEKPRNQMIPRFIYREFQHIEKCKNQAVATGKRLVRAAELECRIAKRKVERHEQKMKRKAEREERKIFLHTKRKMQPLVQEIDRRRAELQRTKKEFDSWNEHSSKLLNSSHDNTKALFEDAKSQFPNLIQRNEYELGQLLHERLITNEEENEEENEELTLKKKAKKKNGHDEEDEEKIESLKSNGLNNKDSKKRSDNLDEKLTISPKKSTGTKMRNVGGPVIPSLASSVQRKWLEQDIPIPADISTHFVPQVGDIVLYYPCAHHAFLQALPDIRCKKLRLNLRRPLWERAIEEKEQLKECKKKNNDQRSKKESLLLNTKPWWTTDWINSVDGKGGAYPIICRVDKVVAEFPYDAESMTELRRFNYKQKLAQEGRKKQRHTNGDTKRRPVMRNKPFLGLNVRLKPLSTISPPQRSSRYLGKFFEDSKLSPPPTFSVLTFPCDQEPFLIPFCVAHQLSISIANGDRVKLLETDGVGKYGTVCNNRSQNDINSSLVLFTEILNKDVGADLSATNKVDTFISICYENELVSSSSIPEMDLRVVIAAVLYQCHKRKIQNDSIDSSTREKVLMNESDSIDNLFNWVLMTLPRWKGVKVTLDEDNAESFYSVWSLNPVPDNNDEGEILAAALAPSVALTTAASNCGGLIYTLDQNLRLDIENAINKFIETNDKAIWFTATVTDKIAPDYSRFVPVSMSLRSILRRLKVYQVKSSKHRGNTEDPAEYDDVKDTYHCYYRSVGAILSDITDIYHNCLLYNHPDSVIVSNALEVTNELKATILHLELKYVNRLKEERLQAQQAALVASGEEKLLSKRSKATNKIVTESLDDEYCGNISSEFFYDSNASDQCNKPWLPQCGDKIIYNRRLHAKFINGHFSSLSQEQRVLPSILPNRKKNKQLNKLVASNEAEDDVNGHNSRHCWLGTVSFVRFCFPPDTESELQTFDATSPFLAIGIQFHYNWLSKEVHVIYWRPCRIHNYGEPSWSCPKCDLDAASSFISPAWLGPVDELLPPYPLNLLHGISKRTVLNVSTSHTIHRCFESLKNRILCEEDIDSFTPSKNLLEDLDLHDVPSEFHHIFKDDSENGDGYLDVDKSISLTEDEKIKMLRRVSFIPSWTSFNKDESAVATRTSNISSTGHDGKDISHHEHLIADPYLCLDVINKRVANGHYRNIVAIAHDLREAFVNSVLLILKQNLKTKQLKIQSCYEILHRISAPTTDSYDDDDNESCPKISVNYSNLYPKERSLLQRLVLIRKLYAMALLCVYAPVKAEIALGIDAKRVIHHQVQGPSENQMQLRKALGKILSSLSHDRCNFRKPLSRTLPLPNVEIRIKPPMDQDRNIDNTLSDSETKIIQFQPEDYERNAPLTCTLLGSNKKSFQVKVAYESSYKKDNKYEPISLDPGDYINNSRLVRFLFARERKTVSVMVKLKYNDMKQTSTNRTKLKSLKDDSYDEEEDDDEFDFNVPFIFQPDDYENDENLIQALLCRPKRRNICARCKISRNGLLTCRVRKAHSNLDFIWSDLIQATGGIDGIIEQLKPPIGLGFAQVHPKSTSPTSNQTHPNMEKDTSLPKRDVDDTHDQSDFDDDGQIEESETISPSEQLCRAEELLQLSHKVLKIAKDNLNSKPCLHEDFLKECNLLDPEDGHYEICLWCGLGGDVLCCEHCPIVSHAKCVGLETIPNGDWYCQKCNKEKSLTLEEIDQLHDPNNEKPDSIEVEKMLDALRTLRQKEKTESKKEENDEFTIEGDDKKVIIKIGMRIVKRSLFEKLGEIISLPTSETSSYEVRYEDGEVEELELEDIEEGLALFEELGGSDVFGDGDDPLFPRTRRRKQMVPYGSEGAELSLSSRKRERQNQNDPDLRPPKKQKELVKNRGRPQQKSPKQKKRGRPRKTEPLDIVTQPLSLTKRKRGRPRKTEPIDTVTQSLSLTKRKRGRPRKTEGIDSDDDTSPPKRSHDQAQSKKHSGAKKGAPATIEELKWDPNPGFVDPSLSYYCTIENDTSMTIARKTGTEWKDVADEPENSVRFPLLQHKRTRFRKGTVVRIPSNCDQKKVILLKE